MRLDISELNLKPGQVAEVEKQNGTKHYLHVPFSVKAANTLELRVFLQLSIHPDGRETTYILIEGAGGTNWIIEDVASVSIKNNMTLSVKASPALLIEEKDEGKLYVRY